jgi:DNA-binding NtrC family response regulator
MTTSGKVFGAQLIGASSAHVAMLDQLRRIAASEAPTLIEGETGSGKELAARAIHYDGPRGDGPFVPVNCGALPDTLIESELFGVQRGAFTDARQSRRGLVAEAERGTLFLDEVDALSAKAQVTLLRFLEDQRYRPVGTAREHCTDVRLIAAANRPLDSLVAQMAFRADLMYRLKILYLVLPPLRARGDDVERLAHHFIAGFAAKYGREPLPLHPLTRAWLHQYPWPGNIRELENWVHRQFLMCSGAAIVHDGVTPDASIAPGPAPDVPAAASGGFAVAKAEAVRRFERDYLRRVLDECGGNVSRAARIAGKERRAFGKLLKKYGIATHAEHAVQGG